MAAVRNIENEVHDAIVTMLLNHADWPVEDANFIRYSQASGTLNPEKPARHDGDYPQAILYLRAGTDSLYTADVTFATHSESGHPYFREKGELVYRMELTSQLLKVTEPSTLCGETRQAFRKAGPTLGIDFIDDVTIRWETKLLREGEQEDGDGLVRWKTTVDIFCKYDLEGRDLITGA